MPPDQFAAEEERLWQQVKPLYDSLFTYVRTRLQEKYGKQLVPDDGPIPADLLGNMWAQDWTNIYPLVAPPNSDQGYDLSTILTDRKTDPKQMVRYGENFYKSLGMGALPDTFWERSLFTKPRDRDVVCHASAWDIDSKKDVRVKDVHRADRGILRGDPPRTRPQLLPDGLSESAPSLPGRRERWIS